MSCDLGERGIKGANHHRGQAETDFIAEQHLGVRHQSAADRQHLLLAAGERGALARRRSFSTGKSR